MDGIVRVHVELSKRKILLIYAAFLIENAAKKVSLKIISSSLKVVPCESKESTATR